MSYVTVKNEIFGSYHKHIVIEDLRITENRKLRKILTNGPNYRKPISINFKKSYFEIHQVL